MPTSTKAYATQGPTDALAPFSIARRDVGPRDVQIDIAYCGICHSDLHQARGEWGNSIYPMVPGHEIVGKVAKVGAQVRSFKPGDLAGVGCFVDSCRECAQCKKGLQQYCDVHCAYTYNSTEMDRKTPTYGGYSASIVVDEGYVLSISRKLSLQAIAPLLCAGITTYSPMRHWKVGKGQTVGVIGLGGLGHMAVKFAHAMGAEVVLFSTSAAKQADAKRLGASKFVLTTAKDGMKGLNNRLDFIIDTVSAPHDVNGYLNTLKTDGVFCLVGAPVAALKVEPFSIIPKRRTVAGSLIGGIPETQEMLDFCAERGIVSDVEVIAAKEINHAYERLLKSDVKYRFVVDMSTL